MSLADRITYLADRFHLSDARFGRIAGVSSTAIQQLKNGTTDNPKISTMNNISHGLQINLDWLITGEGPMMKSDNMMNEPNPMYVTTPEPTTRNTQKDEIEALAETFRQVMLRMDRRIDVLERNGNGK